MHGTQLGNKHPHSELEDLKAGESTKWVAERAEKRLLRGNELEVLMCKAEAATGGQRVRLA